MDKAAAERRVAQRCFAPGESYADFAAGRNKVKERVLLAQFYQCVSLTVRALISQPTEPKTLKEAVDRAMEIDDNEENVALAGNAGTTAVIPGVGRAQLPATSAANNGTDATSDVDAEGFAAFTNPRGLHNKL
ncbi:hypothetical protein ON010_g6630 [Phytophthora cinnamomi]|nr:hypothetical protein ON010_g6630 [Phytophthora cinnamomi]